MSYYFGGDEDCAVSTEIHGRHVYHTLQVSVLNSGTFTFRAITTNPLGDYIGLEPMDPIGDPFLAVYSSFSIRRTRTSGSSAATTTSTTSAPRTMPSTPPTDGSSRAPALLHRDADARHVHPGPHDLEDLSTEDFTTGYSPWEDADFAIGPKTVTFRLWGPTGALAIGPGLTATGGEASALWLGAVLALAGAVLLAVRRRVVRRSAIV